MAPDPKSRPSFSPYRKWGMGLQVLLIVLVVLAVVVMVNILSHDYFLRLHVSARTKTVLSPRTVRFLHTLTNQVNVTVYYDKDDSFYSTVVDLLNEYRTINPKISIRTVDYTRDAGAAQQLKTKSNYGFLNSREAKNYIIFDCDGRVKFVDGKVLGQYHTDRLTEEVAKDNDSTGPRPWGRRRLIAFDGERSFTASLLAVTSLKPLTACFLTGHGEHSIGDLEKELGYGKLASVLLENFIEPKRISLLGTNSVPDCNLLVAAGPTVPISESELEKIDQYLKEGGRMLVLFNASSLKNGETGLEKILVKWGVEVSSDIVVDPDRTSSVGKDVIALDFSQHPIVNPFLGSEAALRMVMPRTVGKPSVRAQAADAPRVEELAYSGPKAYLHGDPGHSRVFPLMAAAEKGAIKDVITERGTTRIVVIGDSLMFDNQLINDAANRDFASYVANWLLDRPQLLEGLGPRPVNEYRLVMTNTQLRSAEWILLAGMPVSVLVLGTLVWLRRRI